ncbi:MAG: S1/P1 Nuclease, partial [Hymenobacter sp.]
MKAAIILCLLFILSIPCRLLAWGREGHQLVAKLAMMQLSESTKQKVLKILGDMTPEQASTWMDEVRSTPDYKYTAPWHYADA